LRDPGTATPVSLLNDQGLTDQGLQFRFKPFLSLDPGLILKGLRTSLGLTDSTGLVLNGDTLLVDGVLSGDQAERLTRLAGVHPLINAVDLSGTRLSGEEALQLARMQLDAPDSVEMTAVDGRIAVSGSSSVSWYLEKSASPQVFGGWKVDFGPLLGELKNTVRTNADQLDGTEIFFTQRDRLSAESMLTLDTFAQQLSGLQKTSNSLNIDLTITLVGQVDGTGTAQQNEQTSRKRVKVVRDKLIGAGVDSKHIKSESPAWNSGGENLSQRRVTVRITGKDRS